VVAVVMSDASASDSAMLGDDVRRPDEVLGYLAHAYTASGLLLVLAATHLVLAERFAAGIVALIACVIIDATDGNLARRWRVTETASYIDGRRLDDIIDYLSFVFVPVLLAVRADLLAQPAQLIAAIILISSAIGFSRVGAKQSAEGFFLGFPSYWNVVIGYLWLFDTPKVFNTILLLVLAVLVLAPVRFLYPTQLPKRADRRRHYVLGAVWGAVCVVALLLPRGSSAQLALATLSLAYPAYYLWCSAKADVAARRRARRIAA
jgi:phosphatidylcholine synthase